MRSRLRDNQVNYTDIMEVKNLAYSQPVNDWFELEPDGMTDRLKEIYKKRLMGCEYSEIARDQGCTQQAIEAYFKKHASRELFKFDI